MKISRIRGLLLWEYGGVSFLFKTWAVSVSLVRPQFWQFRINRYRRLREYFAGPVAFIFWHTRYVTD